MTKTLFNGLLEFNIPTRIRPTGLSMHPFIRRGDYVTITPLSSMSSNDLEDTIKPGDCVIFRDDSERWLIHRVIGKNSSNAKIIAKGDALLQPDQPVNPEVIRGKVSIIHRENSGKDHRLDLPLNRRICRLIALLSLWEAGISSLFGLRRREVEISAGFELITRVIKFPKWILTRAFFP